MAHADGGCVTIKCTILSLYRIEKPFDTRK